MPATPPQRESWEGNRRAAASLGCVSADGTGDAACGERALCGAVWRRQRQQAVQDDVSQEPSSRRRGRENVTSQSNGTRESRKQQRVVGR